MLKKKKEAENIVEKLRERIRSKWDERDGNAKEILRRHQDWWPEYTIMEGVERLKCVWAKRARGLEW